MAVDSKDVARAHLADAGVEELPDDWDVVTLGDLFTEDRGIAVGVMYPGDHHPDGVPLIKAGDLNGSIINPQPDFRISKDKHHEYRRTALEGGELLMTLVGNVGQCAVVPPRMAGWNTARAVAVMRLKDSSETHFVQQCLLSRPLQHLMDVWCNTTVQATLNLKEIRQLPLPWPPKQSRDAIAAFGKALDDKIELNRRMNATLESMARALFQSWFIDFDPVRAKLDNRHPTGMDAETAALFPDGFNDTDVGAIPKGWKIERLGDHVELQRGKTYKSKLKDLPGPYLLGLGSIGRNGGFRAEKLTTYGGDCPANLLVHPGELFVSLKDVTQSADLLGSVARLPLHFGIGRLTQDTVKLKFLKNAPSRNIVYRTLLTPEYRAHCRSHATGTTNLGLAREDFLSYPLIVPSIEVQRMFDAHIDSIERQIAVLANQSRTLATLRDTLLPKLLSGELITGDQQE
jgi:type I restriction enzyme S subunit